LIKRWNNSGDEELADFIKLLRVPDVLEKKIREEELKNKIDAIKKHPLFRVLLDDGNFRYAYDKIKIIGGSEKYKAIETEVRLLESIIISFTLYARRVGGKKQEPDGDLKKDVIEKAQKAAKDLISRINKAGNIIGDPYLRESFDASLKYVEFIAAYKVPKPLRKDDTFFERTFLLDLVRWFKRHSLPRSVALTKRIVAIIGCDSLNDERNLRKYIKEFEKRCDQELERQEQWQRVKGG